MSALLSIALVAVRITAMVVTAPILGHRSVPFFVKMMLAVLLSIAAAPLVAEQFASAQTTPTVTPSTFVSAAFSEALIGGLLGLGILVIFSTAQMIGVAIGQMSGLQLDAASQADQSIGQLPVERLIGMVAVAVFVLGGGPELMMSALLDSFSNLPVGSVIQKGTILTLITSLLSQSFELTVLAIAPAVASLLISTIVVGILMRTLPQLNLIQVGLSSNVAMMMLAMILTLGGCVWMMMDEIQPTLARISDNLNTFVHSK